MNCTSDVHDVCIYERLNKILLIRCPLLVPQTHSIENQSKYCYWLPEKTTRVKNFFSNIFFFHSFFLFENNFKAINHHKEFHFEIELRIQLIILDYRVVAGIVNIYNYFIKF